jgi:hypothetical protein
VFLYFICINALRSLRTSNNPYISLANKAVLCLLYYNKTSLINCVSETFSFSLFSCTDNFFKPSGVCSMNKDSIIIILLKRKTNMKRILPLITQIGQRIFSFEYLIFEIFIFFGLSCFVSEWKFLGFLSSLDFFKKIFYSF